MKLVNTEPDDIIRVKPGPELAKVLRILEQQLMSGLVHVGDPEATIHDHDCTGYALEPIQEKRSHGSLGLMCACRGSALSLHGGMSSESIEKGMARRNSSCAQEPSSTECGGVVLGRSDSWIVLSAEDLCRDSENQVAKAAFPTLRLFIGRNSSSRIEVVQISPDAEFVLPDLARRRDVLMVVDRFEEILMVFIALFGAQQTYRQ
jgi:hypothetical protein